MYYASRGNREFTKAGVLPMNGASRVRIRMENFGPIGSGEFELRPLTVFIGPNNTGKSYAGTLAYTITRVLPDRFGLGGPSDPYSAFFRREYEASLTGAFEHPLSGFPPDRRQQFASELTQLVADLPGKIELAFWSYFSSSTGMTIRRAGAARNGLVSISDDTGNQLIEVLLDEKPRTNTMRLSLLDESTVSFRAVPPTSEQFENALVTLLVENAWRAFLAQFGLAFGSSHYLPSARSGILAGWPLLASLAIDVVRRQIGFQELSVPPLAGTIGDFVQSVIRIVSDAGIPPNGTDDSPLKPAIQILERGVLSGSIAPSSATKGSVELEYVMEDLTLPVQRASSMVGEVAPLVLLLHRMVQPNDLLVIDEPEAHLHPENQRQMTRVLVRLATAGVTVIAPTHSSTIIHQLSNLVRASHLTAAERRELGLEESDRISPEDVGVYAFHPTEDGSVIQEVAFDPEFGYPEDQFLEVAESLSRETYWIDTKLEPVPA